MRLPLELLVIALCMLAEAFFSGMETGVISVNRLRLLHLVRNGSRAARIVEGFLRETNRLLGTTLVGTNISVVVISTLVASVAYRNWGERGQAAGAVLTSLTLLVCCEYVPKAWFNSRPISRCLRLAFLLRAAERLLRPLSLLALAITRWADPGGRRARIARNPFVTREHLQFLARDSEASGQISALERLMINRVLDLQLQTAADIMTPRERLVSVRVSTPLATCEELFSRHRHLKLPVFDDAGERCVGVLYVRDVLGRVAEGAAAVAGTYMKPAFFLAEATRADDVLPILRRQRHHMAVVRNAAGQIRGIVTIENVLKELVGNLPPGATGERRSQPAGGISAPEAA